MIMSKRVLCCLIIITILSGIGTQPVMAKNEEKCNTGGQILENIYETETANEQYEYIEQCTEMSQSSMKGEYLTVVLESSKERSGQYGGVYIDDNNELVVMLTDVTNENIEYCKKAIGDKNVNFAKCKVSKDELEALKEHIVDIWSGTVSIDNRELDGLLQSIVSVGVYIEKNMVSVTMENCSEEKIALFKKYISNSEYITFEEAEICEDNSEIIKTGAEIKIETSDGPLGGFSMGFRCRKLTSKGTYIYGFVTAGHGTKVNGAVYSSTDDKIGYVYSKSHTNNGNTDAAFICVSNKEYSCSNGISYIGGNLASATCTSDYTTGLIAYKVGFKSGYTFGEIVSSDETVSVNGVTTNDLVKAKYYSTDGDSGGLVYMFISAGAKSIAGIHKACTRSGSYSYFVKFANIRKDLGIIIY